MTERVKVTFLCLCGTSPFLAKSLAVAAYNDLVHRVDGHINARRLAQIFTLSGIESRYEWINNSVKLPRNGILRASLELESLTTTKSIFGEEYTCSY